jgi:L-galactono-1,4-lactone dehydrogenase
MGWSDEILGFDCGGQQWVSKTCFPTGTLAKPSMKDLDYMENLLKLIEKEDIPAPAPIEQRWTASSKSPMSPASSSEENDIFSWVNFPSIQFFVICLICGVFATCHHPPKSLFFISD